MPRPFPGMDPYLEVSGLWHGFHNSLMTYIRDALQPLVRPKYRAGMDERFAVDSGRNIYPDVSVVEEPSVAYATLPAAEETYDPPQLVRGSSLPLEPPEIIVEIRVAGAGGKLVTLIELVSPSNKKRGKRRLDYIRKQAEVLASDANLVEIDLLLGGDHVLAVPPEELDEETEEDWDYLVCVNRPRDRELYEVYPIPLAKRLPRVAIPLLPEDKDVVLDLQAMFAQCYDNGAYEGVLSYAEPLPTVTDGADAAWIDGLLREKGLRGHEPKG